MFETLSDRLQEALSEVRSKGKLDEADIDRALRQIRLALLEADVNFKVVKQFTVAVKEKSLGVEVTESLNPGQQLTKLVHQQLIELLGGASSELIKTQSPPTVVLVAGLQGSGKTTACGKLAARFVKSGQTVAVAACDLQRPAAVEQLELVAEKAGAKFFGQGTDGSPVEVAAWALSQAQKQGLDYLIVDSAGRLHIDKELMDELVQVKKAVKPHSVLLVLDAMTGQDAINVAEEFEKAVDFDGVVLTKLDGDARGGAALSVKAVTGKPIVFVSTGERLDAFDKFHPDRMASRILGMGDVLSLVEKAEEVVDAKQAKQLEEKIRKQTFSLDDFLNQMRQMRKLGPVTSLLGMIPGFSAAKELRNLKVDERELDRVQAIITSMTQQERLTPAVINGSRRRRIAQGSGTTVQAVNRLVKQFGQMQKMMKQMSSGKMPALDQMMGQIGGRN